MSLLDDLREDYSIGANTVKSWLIGTLWSAGTGTVDPWTKDNLVQDEAQGVVQASAGSIDPNSAKAMAYSDVTNQLIAAGADPSQVQGFDVLKTLGDMIFVAILVIIGYYIFMAVSTVKK
jgi:hypothetical protein